MVTKSQNTSNGLGRWALALTLGTATICAYELTCHRTAFAESPPKQHGMRSLIPAFAKIQDTLHSVGYKDVDDFPQIVVVGAQSSGKSSVLEMIVGEEFLPKGEGTVTKRPIVLTLHNTSDQPGSKNKYGIFPDLSNEKIYDFSVIEQKIRAHNKKLSDAPLILHIYSPDVVDLRLVDLPGLIHNPIKEQPENMRELVKDICKTYLEGKQTVILAITPANTDIQACEALRFARKFDPNGERTLSVLTKMDLVDDNSYKSMISTINNLPLHLGYVGVKCRSSEQIKSKLTVTQAIDQEQEHFRNNHRYAKSGVQLGTPNLASELSKMLQRQLEVALPKIVDKLRSDLYEVEENLKSIGGPAPHTQKEKDYLLLQEVNRFLGSFYGAPTAEEIKENLGKRIYELVRAECDTFMKDYAKPKSQAKPTIAPTVNTPVFWEGQEDIRYQRWQEQIRELVHQLSTKSNIFTQEVVEDLLKRVKMTSKVLENRPNLQLNVTSTTNMFLTRNFDEVIRHLKYIILLENNIANNKETHRNNLKQLKNAGLIPWLKGDAGDEAPYGVLWTQAYVLMLAERVSTNIFNAVSMEILDALVDKLRNTYTVELFGENSSQRDTLLQERDEVHRKRSSLSAQNIEIQRALNVLSNMMKGIYEEK